ncbi:MAG: VOC family protein [Ktedonobacterales bacterium]
MPTYTKLTPNLMVEDVDATVDFYRDVLGFTLAATAPDQRPFDWAMVNSGGAELMFQSRASLGGEVPILRDRDIGGALTFYVEVEDIEALFAHVKDRLAIVVDLHDTFYGAREFAAQDPNGYILGFAGRVTHGGE